MNVISTIEANCKDCYKCIRYCTVKAIRFTGGHAEIVPERCLADGRCIDICPQKAKKVRDDTGRVKEMLSSPGKVCATVAPSFVGTIGVDTQGKFVSALRKLGFDVVHETAFGAELVAREHVSYIKQHDLTYPLISSPCAALIEWILKYYPDLVPHLAPIVSPMIADGRYLKHVYGDDTKVVFIGPCVAKKLESEDEPVRGAVDVVLTYEEIGKLFKEAGIEPDELSETEFDGPHPDAGRLFPVVGGLLEAAALGANLTSRDVLTVSGYDECREFLESFAELKKDGPRLVEILVCPGGCVNGPFSKDGVNLFARRKRVLDYYEAEQRKESAEEQVQSKLAEPSSVSIDLSRKFISRPVQDKEPLEEETAEILAKTGKYGPEDELNCGACGYPTCREKAKAVFNGMAEVEMCIPHMRSLAESRSNLITSTTPNAIVVTDMNLKILELNPAAEQAFRANSQAVSGMPLSLLFDPGDFRKVRDSKSRLIREKQLEKYGLYMREIIFHVAKQDIIIGIFVDVTREKKQQAHLNELRRETIQNAQEVINKQMRVAQEIAGLLGETTAETKVLLSKVMDLIKEGDIGR